MSLVKTVLVDPILVGRPIGAPPILEPILVGDWDVHRRLFTHDHVGSSFKSLVCLCGFKGKTDLGMLDCYWVTGL